MLGIFETGLINTIYQYTLGISIKKTELMQFWGIEAPNHYWSDSNYVSKISKRELWWIHQLGSLAPGGLNKEFDLKCFLSNS